MSISGISSDPTVYQNYASSPFQHVKSDFAALGKALNSGDLTTAQTAFTTLQSDLQAAGQTQSGQQTGATSQLSADLAALGKAIQSGNVSDAQKAFQTLQKDMQQARKAHHHHDGGSAQNTQNTTSNPFSDLAAIGNALQSGDLSGAQSAFATLQQDTGTSSGQSTTSTTSTPGTDLTALSSALQSGNLSDAQNAFATLMQDLQNSIATVGGSTVGATLNTTA
jgi:hypothetical protein